MIKIDFRDDISVNLIGLKIKDFEYIKDYCKKHSYIGCNMTLEHFVMNALRHYLKELRAKEDDADTICYDCGERLGHRSYVFCGHDYCTSCFLKRYEKYKGE